MHLLNLWIASCQHPPGHEDKGKGKVKAEAGKLKLEGYFKSNSGQDSGASASGVKWKMRDNDS